MEIASATKGHFKKEFADIIDKIDRLYPAIQKDAERLGYGLVLCHNDTYEPNYLYDDKGEMYLIDWEYAGMNYAVNDIGCILCRYDWTDEQIERYLRYYVGRELTADKRRFYYGFIPISAFYWFGWGLYKDGNSALMLVCARLRYVAGSSWGEKRYMNMEHLLELESQTLVG